MNKLMKFENSAVEMRKINGVWMFELYSVGMALGQVRKNAKGIEYARKDRIDENTKSAEIQPCVRNGHKYITESQVYDLMLETRTDKCRAFRKWLTNEVLPELNHTGTFNIKKDKQLEMYNYFDKTYKGEPVMTVADVKHFTGINAYNIRKALKNAVEIIDYYDLKGKELSSFKAENKQYTKLSCELILITKDGFKAICKSYGLKIETPKLFIEEKKDNDKQIKRTYNKRMDDYITALNILREERKSVIDIGISGAEESFNTCIHYICMAATAYSI